MSRVQLALRVPDLPAPIASRSTLFCAERAELRDGYADFAIADPPLELVLVQGAPDEDTRIDHLGVEVDTGEAVRTATTRLAGQGLATDVENDTACCHALQDKAWIHGPGRQPWEVNVVKADADSMTEQKGSTRCADPAVTGAGPAAPVEAGGRCP
ncbi:ArsI/CadI family heavy metal resistance metalloenzyme [Streptomyces sp. NPDC093149]|uniref:ArsI/CadI family heavy metal resistance metalloenzyme n=1 Tax=Streptomyces sp. NPDC093149 TaxID=3366031 RepID=UPI00380E090F